MKPRFFYFLMTAVLGSTSVLSSAAKAQVTEISQIDPRSAFTPKRWVGLRPVGSAHCPDVPNWRVESLLDSARKRIGIVRYQERYKSREAVDNRRLRRLGLDRYCIYTAQTPDFDFDPEFKSDLIAAKPDRLANTTTSAGGLPSDRLSQAIWPTLAVQFSNQTGQDPSVASGMPSSVPPKVRLTFLDSEPDREGAPPRPPVEQSQHGFTLLHIARDLACPSRHFCAATLASRQALRYRDFDPDSPMPPQDPESPQSGHVGLVSDLATAILAEVLAWRSTGQPQHLILNLSLGWDGELFGDLQERRVSRLDPAVQDVYNALRFARLSGALVIAAAGNRRGGAEETQWPLLPAAWELRRPTFLPFPLGPKPVYAAGGVDWQNLRLANSRNGGQPRRVAYADHAVTHVDATDPTAIYTGTSVAAAVTSSIAAVIWHLRPELKPSEVMRLLTCSGDELPSRADYYAWREIRPLSRLVAAPHLRRLSLCSAVARACGPQGRRCALRTPPPACQEPVPRYELKDIIARLSPTPLEIDVTPSDIAGDRLVDISDIRWIFPQPDTPPCPGCTLVPTKPPGRMNLTLQIDETWRRMNPDVELNRATLHIEVDGRRQAPRPLSSDVFRSGIHSVAIAFSSEPPRSSSYRAWIDFHIVHRRGSTHRELLINNPVIIAPVR